MLACDPEVENGGRFDDGPGGVAHLAPEVGSVVDVVAKQGTARSNHYYMGGQYCLVKGVRSILCDQSSVLENLGPASLHDS